MLLYFAPRDVLIPRVERQCTMRFCEAMAARGIDVEVVSLDVRLDYDEPSRSRGLFDVYGIRTPFRVAILPNRMRQSSAERVNPLWRMIIYSTYAYWRLLVQRKAFEVDSAIIYFRNYLLGVPLLVLRKLLGKRLVLLFEITVPPSGSLRRALLRRMDGVTPISETLARKLRREIAIDPMRIQVAHEGVNLHAVEEARLGKEEARAQLDLPLDKQLVVYTGKVHDWSVEIDLLLRCAAMFSAGVEFVIVGGREDHVNRLRKRSNDEGIMNVRFRGFVAPADIFHFQMAADVLVMYYPTGIPLNEYRSPGKLFEYMASRRPIVTADYPSLHEVLSSRAAVFVQPDDPKKLAAAIQRLLTDEALAERIAEQAYADVQGFTWELRAERVHRLALRVAELGTRGGMRAQTTGQDAQLQATAKGTVPGGRS